MANNLAAEQILGALQIKLADARGALVATLDGITVASAQVQHNSNQIGAMTAAALGLGKRLIETVAAGELREISATGSDGSVFVYAVGAKNVLVVVTKKQPNVALVNWEARKTISELTQAFA